MKASGLTREQLVYSRERVLFAVMVIMGPLLYAGIVGFAYLDAATGGVMLFYAVLLALFAALAHAYALGRIRGNGVLVSERQFPMLYQLVAAHAQKLELSPVPTVYVVESGGILNAFATKMLGRKFIILHSDMLAMAVRRGTPAVSFIMGHELGHHWRRHLTWRWLIAPARFVPYLGAAYSRACEYTCDRVGAYCEPDGAIDGLLILAVGGWLHTHVSAEEFAQQGESDRGFWIRRAELVSTHPRLPKRVAALMALGVTGPAAVPLVAVDTAA